LANYPSPLLSAQKIRDYTGDQNIDSVTALSFLLTDSSFYITVRVTLRKEISFGQTQMRAVDHKGYFCWRLPISKEIFVKRILEEHSLAPFPVYCGTMVNVSLVRENSTQCPRDCVTPLLSLERGEEF
jgi:hypothetical protein